MTYDELAGSVKLSEGFRDHVYIDTEGFRTIGWGHKVVHEDNFEDGKTYTKEELQEVFDKDLNTAIGKARTLMEEHGVTDLPTTAQHTITEMVFQLGPTGVSSSVTCGNACRKAILLVRVTRCSTRNGINKLQIVAKN